MLSLLPHHVVATQCSYEFAQHTLATAFCWTRLSYVLTAVIVLCAKCGQGYVSMLQSCIMALRFCLLLSTQMIFCFVCVCVCCADAVLSDGKNLICHLTGFLSPLGNLINRHGYPRPPTLSNPLNRRQLKSERGRPTPCLMKMYDKFACVIPVVLLLMFVRHPRRPSSNIIVHHLCLASCGPVYAPTCPISTSPTTTFISIRCSRRTINLYFGQKQLPAQPPPPW